MTTFADHAIGFNADLAKLPPRLAPCLPDGFELMNPYADGVALPISTDFYRRFYADAQTRHIILGINPGRHGAGLTGVPFTDSKRLLDPLGISPRELRTHEPSAVFVYAVIAAWGGAEAFYRDFYINSPLPMGLLRRNARAKLVNANYYDSRTLTAACQPLIDWSMQRYIDMPIKRNVAWCFGKDKNYKYLKALNAEHGYFERIVPLEHPRYVEQYKSKQRQHYVQRFVDALAEK